MKDAAGVFQRLLKSGVIVRPIAGYGMPDFLRVSIGLPEENQRFLDSLARALV
jgi:histidinol-phosphate aminotransferase